MLVSRILILIALFVATPFSFCLANYAPAPGEKPTISTVPKSLIMESFENSFPPPGWEVEVSNPEKTWRRVSSACNGDMKPGSKDHFAYVRGTSGEFVNELLITPKLQINRGKGEEISQPEITFEYNISEISNENNFQVLFSFDYDTAEEPTWEAIWPEQWLVNDLPFFWKEGFVELDNFINNGPFRIAFLLTGDTKVGIGLDMVDARYDLITEVEEEDDEGCGCSITSSNVSLPLDIVMLLIGFAALAFHRWKRKRL